MNEIVSFNFEGSGVRVVERDGEPWFVAKDVAALLGYAKPENAVATHCKGVTETAIPSRGGRQNTKLIPERDVYRLIMRSRLPAAERFEEWVVGTVLPSVRKHGGYIAQQETLDPQEIMAPLTNKPGEHDVPPNAPGGSPPQGYGDEDQAGCRSER